MKIESVLRMRNIGKLETEKIHRLNKIGYHNLRQGQECDCPVCKTNKNETQQITRRIEALQ